MKGTLILESCPKLHTLRGWSYEQSLEYNEYLKTRFAGFPSSSGGAEKIFIIPLSCLTTFVSEVF